MNSTTYLPFSAIDYTGVDTVSSYALSATPLVFIPDYDHTSNRRAVWDFGDGTISKSLSASKSYDFPGTYTVSLVVYDCNNNALISTEQRTVTIYDYLPLTFTITNPMSSVRCGVIEGPSTINCRYPYYQPPLDIYYSVRNSGSVNFWSINDSKFSHLESFYTIYDRIYNYALSEYQFVESSKITPVTGAVYVKVYNNTLSYCLSSDSGACFAGVSGIKDIYFRDDTPTDKIIIDFAYDKTNYINPYISDFKYINNLGISLSAAVLDNTPTRLSITSNGLDGEGTPINSFDISNVKFNGTKIPFVVKIKDALNFSVKNYNPNQLSAFNIVLRSNDPLTTSYTISSLAHTLSSQNSGGAFRGYVYIPSVDAPLENVWVSASGVFINSESQTYALSGISESFTVYPNNYYDAYSKNEDFDASETLKSLRFQEILLDKPVLFDDVFGGVLGGVDHNAIGTKIYERIANFAQNTQDVDKCGLEFLNSLGDFVGYNELSPERYVYPDRVKRLMDLLSVENVKLLGYQNKYVHNFDTRGHSDKDIYGINIGDMLDTMTYTVSSDVPIVALEKFSNDYTLLNTYQPISATGSHTYPLSSYSSDWGWPLVLPAPFSISDMDKYYTFFGFVAQFDFTILGGSIDFDNPKTTISVNQSTATLGELKEYLLADTLYQSLDLVD